MKENSIQMQIALLLAQLIMKVVLRKSLKMNILSQNQRNLLKKSKNFIQKNLYQDLVLMNLAKIDKKWKDTNSIMP